MEKEKKKSKIQLKHEDLPIFLREKLRSLLDVQFGFQVERTCSATVDVLRVTMKRSRSMLNARGGITIISELQGGPSVPPVNRRLVTDFDLQDAMERQIGIRVFERDHLVHSGGAIIRFDDRTVVIQAGVSDLSYFTRANCEFFELKKG